MVEVQRRIAVQRGIRSDPLTGSTLTAPGEGMQWLVATHRKRLSVGQTTRIASISTNTARGNAATCTQALAG